MLLAHRGTSLMAPENTLPAFEFAVRHSADVLEIDVRLSRDGEVIVTHDDSLERTTDGTGKVNALGLHELKQLDAGYRFACGEQFPWRNNGVQLLTLSELLLAFPDVGINIDIKDNDARAVVAVASALETHAASERSVVASFHDSNLRFCRRRYPQLRTSAGIADVKKFYWNYLLNHRKEILNQCTLFQLPMRHYFLSLSSQRFINFLHSAGGEVNYWTINDCQSMVQLLERGADGIVTDRADLAVDVLAQFNSKSH